MNRKIAFYLVMFTVTVILTAVAVTTGMTLHTRYLSIVKVDDAAKKLEQENESLKIRRDILQSDVGSKTDDTTRKDELNRLITEITGQISTAKLDITGARNEADDLNAKADELNRTLDALRKGMNLSAVSSRSLNNSQLMCPSQIGSGRYIATGSGVITILASSGTARISEDLAAIDTKSYTFDLAEGESVKSNGEITITELK